MAPKKYTGNFIVTLNGSKRVGSFRHVEDAEFCASNGRRRRIYQWFEGRYILKRIWNA